MREVGKEEKISASLANENVCSPKNNKFNEINIIMNPITWNALYNT